VTKRTMIARWTALVAVLSLLLANPAAASPPSRSGPSWANHLQGVAALERSGPPLGGVRAVADAPTPASLRVVPKALPTGAVREAPPAGASGAARPTLVVPEGRSAASAPLQSIREEILRPLPPDKVRVVIDLQSPQKAVWLRQGSVETAIPVEITSPLPIASRPDNAGLARTVLEQMAKSHDWRVPQAIVLDYKGNNVGVRWSKGVEMLNRAATLPFFPPRTRRERKRPAPVQVARR